MKKLLKYNLPVSVVAAPLLAAAVEIDLNEVRGVDLWGGRKAHPAVVNPVLPQDPATVVSLCGDWDFTTYAREGRREVPLRNGIWGYFYKTEWKNARKLRVPGCWEAQGVGEPGMGEAWDPHWDDGVKPLRHKFTGVGWYRRTVEIPAAWTGRRVWLKVGGVKAIAHVWVNERQVALVDNLSATTKYDVTDLVTPGGKATVVFHVDNRKPSRAGESNEVNRWGGIVRAVEFEATPSAVWIDDAWVRGDFDGRLAKVNVELGGVRDEGRGMRLRVAVGGETAEARIRSADETVAVPLRSFRPWSPEQPNLYTAKVELVGADGRVVQTRLERFGVRKLEVRGKEFYLNGRPYFFRGFGDDSVYPITGQPPADRDVHRRHLAVARRCGFNFVRLHTHCEVSEYFEAADELGILIQAELPYYSDVPAESFSFDPVRDVTEVWRTFRRHPSLAVYSMGNEGSFGPDLDRALHRYVKAMDPDRLKINQDCHVARINPPEAADYCGGPITIWPRGTCDPDRPFVTHEYMNLGIKLDSRLEPRFTGVWQPPVTRAARAAWLATFGLDLAWGDRLQNAQHALQAVWQKRGIEAARTDPHCDGFCYWTIVDVVVANRGTYSGQGLFNPFWEAKINGSTADDVRVYNRPVGLFCDIRPNRRVFKGGETFDADFLVANYGEAELGSARVDWKVTCGGATLAAGTCPCGTLARGGVRTAGAAKIAVPRVAENAKARLEVALVGEAGGAPVTASDNAYPLWLFAARAVRREPTVCCADALLPALGGRYADLIPEARAAEAEVVVAPYGSPVGRSALARGQKAILLGPCAGEPNVKLGWWGMGSQVGTAFLDHPVFKGLPHDGVLDELFFRIVKEGRRLPVEGLRAEDLFAVGEGGASCSLYLGQAKVEKGRALLVFGLDVLADTAEGAALLDGMIDYARSSAFAPAGVHTLP